jgi:transcriptional regulator GlxA family with amidase domain
MKAMHDQPGAAWTVERMARIAGVSRATFSRRFGDLVGETPMAYLNGWRLAVASDLLARGTDTVDAVAREVGYANGYALSVAFKRVYGLRPSDYRRADALVG